MTKDVEEFDHVLIDMNQILHVVLRRRVDEDKALFSMFKELDDTLKYAHPRRCVVFAFDGPPPAAKLATQRSRRAKSVQSTGHETFESVWGNKTATGKGIGESEAMTEDWGHLRFVKRVHRHAEWSEKRKRRGENGTKIEANDSDSDSDNDNDNEDDSAMGAGEEDEETENKFVSDDLEEDNDNLDSDLLDDLEGPGKGKGVRYRVGRQLSEPDEEDKWYFSDGFLEKTDERDESNITLANICTPNWLEVNKKRRKLLRKTEEVMVKITPGTDFMSKAAEAVLYWAWQRLCQRKWKHIKFYISGADVAGEGEVKLLDWTQIPTLVRPGDSVAMIGGDSDLVLEGLALDPQITHNTFVILPERKTASYCVSLWETTRSLKAMFPKMDSTTDVINMRTDLVALMIMNGNDYFGKIRGANFERLFSSYKETVNKFYQEPHSCFLINPQTLEFNNRFCLEFFSSLVEKATGDGNLMGEIMEEMPKGYDEDDDEISLMFKNSVYTVDSNIKGTVHSVMENTFPSDAIIDDRINMNPDARASEGEREMPLSVLHTLISQRIIPGPYPPKFAFSRKRKKAFLTIGGERGISDQIVFSVTYGNEGMPYVSTKKLKQVLAGLALDVLIPDWMDSSSTVFKRNPSTTNSSPHDIIEYMKGILWNLEMYQKGVCTDYSFNYGRRRSPTVVDMLRMFQKTDEANMTIGIGVDAFKTNSNRKDGKYPDPLHSAISLLCSMPSTESHLIDRYFDPIVKNGAIDELYESCIDKETGWFNMSKFNWDIRNDLIAAKERGETDEKLAFPGNRKREDSDKRVSIGRNFWTVLKNKRPDRKGGGGAPTPKQFLLTPPAGFCDDMKPLYPNPAIRAHSVKASKALSKEERRKTDELVFGTTLSTAFDHLENNSVSPDKCEIDDEGRPSLECLPFKLAYAHRLTDDELKNSGSNEGSIYDENGNAQDDRPNRHVEGFVDHQIDQAIKVGKLWYDDAGWTSRERSKNRGQSAPNPNPSRREGKEQGDTKVQHEGKERSEKKGRNERRAISEQGPARGKNDNSSGSEKKKGGWKKKWKHED